MRATRSTWCNLQALGEPPPALEQATGGLSPPVAQLLHNRGIDARKAPTFLAPQRGQTHDPFLLRDMDAAIERLLRARKDRELVALFGDLDVDGIAAVAVLAHACEMAGITSDSSFLTGASRGTNLDGQTLKDLAARGVHLVVTADCGISDAGGASAARENGLDLIITDHHRPPECLPEAHAIVNPRQPDCSYPNKNLAGVGVAYKTAQALLSAVGANAGSDRVLLDLVAVGTIADMVPLLDENRLLVWNGMRILNQTNRPGLQALVARSGLHLGSLTSTDVSYRLCPRLNAAGQDDRGSLGYDVLMTRDGEAADLLAHRLQEKHVGRQVLTQRALDAVHSQLDIDGLAQSQRLIVARIEPWALSVMGLLTGKLVEEFGRPAVVLSEVGDEVRGSGRGTPAFDVLAALRANARLLNRFGGHEMAAGFTVDPVRVEPLIESLQRRAEQLLSEEDVQPVLRIDAEVSARDLTWSLYEELQVLEPFGAGNPLPVFLCRRLNLYEFRGVGNHHLRLVVGKGSHRLPAMLFRGGDLIRHLRRNMEMDVVFSLEANDWDGRRTLQLSVKDLMFEPAYGYDLNTGLA